MTTLREAAQQALEALVSQFDGRADAIDILSAALAEPEPCQYPDCVDNGPEGKCTRWLLAECEKSEDYKPQREPLAEPVQEPVAWRCSVCGGGPLLCLHNQTDVPLYAEPPQRRPLSADETMSILNATAGTHWCDEAHLQRFRVAIERAHGIGE